MRKHGHPEKIVTDRLWSEGAALQEIGPGHRAKTGRWLNNRAESACSFARERETASPTAIDASCQIHPWEPFHETSCRQLRPAT